MKLQAFDTWTSRDRPWPCKYIFSDFSDHIAGDLLMDRMLANERTTLKQGAHLAESRDFFIADIHHVISPQFESGDALLHESQCMREA